MSFTGIGSAGWVVLCFNFVILASWPGLALLALFSLRARGLAGNALAIWLLIIVAVPLLGALAYLIVRSISGSRCRPTLSVSPLGLVFSGECHHLCRDLVQSSSSAYDVSQQGPAMGCGGIRANPTPRENMVLFFAQKAGGWYYVGIGAYAK
jgi:hypothetical protein